MILFALACCTLIMKNPFPNLIDYP